MMKKIALFLIAATALLVAKADAPHVYINPGHGGYDSDDRNVQVAPFASLDTNGYWESKSNLKKGLALQSILQAKGYTTSISRVTNTTDDDLKLSTIVALSNASGADVFYAIHSNATGTTTRNNFPLGLYRGYTGEPQVAGSDVLAADLEPYLYANQSTVWTSNYAIYGDWTFQPSWGTQGYGVLRGNKVVSMLSEGSFHDYVPETYRLLNADYCWMEAWNISLGADKYFDILGNFSLGVVTGNIRDERIERVQEGWAFQVYGDDALMPIHNALVELLDSEGNVVQTCVTDTLRNGIYLFKYVEPGTYSVRVSDNDVHFPQTKQITVSANAPTYQNFYLKKVRNTPPEVIEYSPVWNEGDPAVKCSEVIVLQFNWDMDSATTCNAFHLEPSVPGTFAWSDSYYCLTFTPDDAFDVNTLYTLTLDKSAQHAGGTEMAEDFVMQFLTQGRNHISVLATWPREGALVHYKTPTCELRTDSLLESKDLFNKMRVLDSEGNEVAWNKRNIKYNSRGSDYGFITLTLSKSLTMGEQYTFVLDRDIADTAGIHLAEPMSMTFTAIDAGEAKDGTTVVDDFEDATEHYFTTATTHATDTTMTASTERLFDSKSLQVKYVFDGTDPADNANAVVVGCPSYDVIYSKNDTLGIHIYGDFSFADLCVAMKETSTGETVEIHVDTLDYYGWHYLAVPLSPSLTSGSWMPESFSIYRTHDVMGRTGTMRFDNMLKAAGSGVRELEMAGVQIINDPASNYIVASADGWVTLMQLYDGAGRAVATADGNVLNVSGVGAGVYVLRVTLTGGETLTTKLIR